MIEMQVNKKRTFMQPFYSAVIEEIITNTIDLRVLSIIIIWVDFLQMVSFSFMHMN